MQRKEPLPSTLPTKTLWRGMLKSTPPATFHEPMLKRGRLVDNQQEMMPYWLQIVQPGEVLRFESEGQTLSLRGPLTVGLPEWAQKVRLVSDEHVLSLGTWRQ